MGSTIGKRGVRYVLRMACSAVFIIVLFCSCQKKGPDLQVSFIDVGKGDCILVQAQEKVMMIDTGYDSTVDKVKRELVRRKINKIDALVLTHYDADHVGGASYLLEDYEIGTVYLPNYESSNKYYEAIQEVISNKNISTTVVSKDMVVEGVGTNCTIYASDIKYDEKKQNDNNVSLVTSLIYKKDSYLFTGDIEKKGIKSFLQRPNEEAITYDIVKMPHHGREKSNLSEFLSKIQPIIAVITDSEEKPADESTLKELKEQEVQVYESSQDGTIVIDSNGVGTYEIEK